MISRIALEASLLIGFLGCVIHEFSRLCTVFRRIHVAIKIELAALNFANGFFIARFKNLDVTEDVFDDRCKADILSKIR